MRSGLSSEGYRLYAAGIGRIGFQDIKTTMDIYAEVNEEKKQESLERLAATWNVF